MVAKIGAACRLALVNTLRYSFITRFLPNFIFDYLSSIFCPSLNTRNDIALLKLSPWCFVTIIGLWLFLTVLRFGLHCV